MEKDSKNAKTDKNNLVLFMEKVFKMRQAQRAYFRNRNVDTLNLSKKLEREVDEMIIELDDKVSKIFDVDVVRCPNCNSNKTWIADDVSGTRHRCIYCNHTWED